jgi:hypothetical protein
MYFDEDEEKKLFEDIQFKRRVEFVDDDNVNEITCKHFSKQSAMYNVVDKGCQVTIQNEITSTMTQTRPRKSKECQTEVEEEVIPESFMSEHVKRLTKILDRRGQLIENAIEENNKTKAFQSWLHLFKMAVYL